MKVTNNPIDKLEIPLFKRTLKFMPNQTRFRLIILFMFFSSISKAQEIHSLPFTYNNVTAPQIKQSFDTLHNFFNKLHDHKKLNPTVSAPPANPATIFSTETWGPGTWGLGMFSEMMHFTDPPIPNWSVYPEWYNIVDYHTPYYYSAHPSLWHTGRIIIAYIHAYGHDPQPIYLQRIKDGLNYVISEQLPSGNFYEYKARKYQGSTEENLIDSFLERFEAIRCLSEGYTFLNSIGDHTMNEALWVAIVKGGDHIKNFVWQPNQNINGYAWGVWALVGAYKATGKAEYLVEAERLTGEIIENGNQRSDGSWITPGFSEENQEIWHDSFMQYHGVILRGLSEIYAITYDQNLKTTLKSKINSTINHVISYNQQYGGDKTRLLEHDYAFISKYHANHTQFNQLIQLTNPVSTNNNYYDLMTSIDFNHDGIDEIAMYDREGKYYKVFNTAGGIFDGVTPNGPLFSFMTSGDFDNDGKDELAFHYTSDDAIVSVLNENLSWSGTMRTYNNNFDLMTSVFDATEERDHVALYDKQAKFLQIYRHNTNTPVFSGNTLNGADLELMASGNFDGDDEEEIVFYQPQHLGSRIYIYSQDLTWQVTIEPNNSTFDLIASVNYDGKGADEIALYDKQTRKLSIYRIGFNAPVFSVNTSQPFDLMSVGNFDTDEKDEIAFYSNTSGNISYFDIDESYPYTATNFLQGLIYVKENVDYSTSDLEKIEDLIQGIFAAINDRVINGKRDVADQNFMTMALYLNPDFGHFELTHIGSIHTAITSFDQIAAVNFDNLGRDEIALYDLQSNLYKVFEDNNNNAVFSGYTPNGAPFNLMTSGDFDNDQKDEIALYMSSYFDGLVSVLNEDLSWRGSIRTYNTDFDMITQIDYDNDNFDDVVLYDKENKFLSIYKNNINTPVFSGNTLNGPLLNLICSGDFDGDGDEEFAFYMNYNGLVSILDKNLSWEASIYTNNVTFDMIGRIDYDGDGNQDEIVLYDRESKLLNIYKRGIANPVFSRFTNNGPEFDLMTIGNFDQDASEEIAFYMNYDGVVTILDIDLSISNPNSGGRSDASNHAITTYSATINTDIQELIFSIVDTRGGKTIIQYQIPQDTYLEIIMYDVKGTKINTFEKGHRTSGIYESSFDTSALSPGLYIYRIITDHSAKSVKMFYAH